MPKFRNFSDLSAILKSNIIQVLCQAGWAHPYLIQNIDLSINIQYRKVGGEIKMVVKYDQRSNMTTTFDIFSGKVRFWVVNAVFQAWDISTMNIQGEFRKRWINKGERVCFDTPLHRPQWHNWWGESQTDRGIEIRRAEDYLNTLLVWNGGYALRP